MIYIVSVEHASTSANEEFADLDRAKRAFVACQKQMPKPRRAILSEWNGIMEWTHPTFVSSVCLPGEQDDIFHTIGGVIRRMGNLHPYEPQLDAQVHREGIRDARSRGFRFLDLGMRNAFIQH